MKTHLRALILTAIFSYGSLQAHANTLELYIDSKTKQVFAEPGPGRVKLGSFVSVDETKAAPAPASISSTPAAAPASTVPTTAEAKPHKNWYDKLSVRGYTQVRYTGLLNHEEEEWFHPADRSVGPDQTLLIRRGRLILSGDVSDDLYVYIQPEMMAAPTDGDFSTQLRDIYGDVALDDKKEWRIRIGQSKVPYGFVNLQSSQNRLGIERPDGINGAVEGERDLGAYLMWAPAEIRERFRKLVKDGLKGSGDYGVIAVGGYNGQGLNRSDTNDALHTVARASYPFLLDSGQFFELGIQGYTGRDVPRTKPFELDAEEGPIEPDFDSNGIKDHRLGVTTVLYPQPFGIEAEWNVGSGPQLSDDRRTIGDESLQGGYVQASYRITSDSTGNIIPFTRYQYFDGGRKFGRNAPHETIKEWDVGVEWEAYSDVELTMMYSFSADRTNTNVYPYETLSDGSRLAFQVQLNY